jgi:predicted glycosyltransferase
MTSKPKSIWIDLDNSPHVPFFCPIVNQLRDQGHTVLLTARDAFQVSDLVRLHGLECATIGRHFGKNSFLKIVGLGVRAAQLLPFAMRNRPDLAVSHGSRAQTLAAKMLLIPSVVIADYEHVKHVTHPDWIIVPEIIPAQTAGKFAKRLLKYPGIKEDVYACAFQADNSLLDALGITDNEIVVTVRPPATEAHYHNAHSEELLAAVMDLLAETANVRVILLPRNAKQKQDLVRRWGRWLQTGKMLVPKDTVNGLNLVWHSDLVVSGGGTMNREAAALGVPVYSIFRGSIGAVDRYLAEDGRLILLESVEDVRQRIHISKRDRLTSKTLPSQAALDTIASQIIAIADRPMKIQMACDESHIK